MGARTPNNPNNPTQSTLIVADTLGTLFSVHNGKSP